MWWGGHGITPSWPMEANSEIRGHVRAREKVLEGMTDRQTDRQAGRRLDSAPSPNVVDAQTMTYRL